MQVSLQLQHLERPGYSIDLLVPNAQEVKASYFQLIQEQAGIPFPHWTKLWPAALALGDCLQQHVELVEGKIVLELAAGLGLPSFIAARYAKAVCCSDYQEEAVTTMARSVHHLALSNVTCQVLDWNHLPDDLQPDVLLLSDINYDPDQFDQLFQVLHRFLGQGTVILLATPQRLMAKPFIEKLLPYCRQQYEMMIEHLQQHTPITILVLQD
jgi:predicted nicotinamide N-methyase